MEMFQHDSAGSFEFVLRGELAGDCVRELERAWETAKSILRGRELAVDISGITDADGAATGLLARMRESGAHLRAMQPPASVEFVRKMGVPVTAPPAGRAQTWAEHLRRFIRFSG